MIGLCVCLAFAHSLGLPLFIGGIPFACVAGPLAIGAAASFQLSACNRQECLVSLEHGIVRFQSGGVSDSTLIQNCCWFRGFLHDSTALRHTSVRKASLVIVFPSGHKVACGTTPEMYETWLTILRHHECRQVLRQEGLLGFLFVVGVIACALNGGMLGWRLGQILANLVPQGIFNPRGVLELQSGLAVLMGLGSGVLPWYTPRWRRHTTEEKAKFSRVVVDTSLRLILPVVVIIGFEFPVAATVIAIVILAVVWKVSRSNLRQSS